MEKLTKAEAAKFAIVARDEVEHLKHLIRDAQRSPTEWVHRDAAREQAEYLRKRFAGMLDYLKENEDMKLARLFLERTANTPNRAWEVEGKDELASKTLLALSYMLKYRDDIKRWMRVMGAGQEQQPEASTSQQALQDAAPEQPTASASQKPQQALQGAGQEQQPMLPKELATDEAKELFAKIEQCKPNGNLYEWTGSNALFGYFVDRITTCLDLCPNGERLDWQMFAAAFQMDEKSINTAREKVSRYKNGKADKPNGWDKIEEVVEMYLLS